MVTGTGIFRDGLIFSGRKFFPILVCMAPPVFVEILMALAEDYVRTKAIIWQFQSGGTETGPLQMAADALLTAVTAAAGALVTAWMLARIYRLRLKAEFPVTTSEAGAVMRIALWLFVLAAGFIASFSLMVLALTPVQEGSAPAFLPHAMVQLGGVILFFGCLFYTYYLLVRLSLLLPGLAIGRSWGIPVAGWRETARVSWSLLSWMLLILLGVPVISFLLAALIQTFWGQGAKDVIHFQTIEEIMRGNSGSYDVAGLVSAAAGHLATAVMAAVCAEGYAQLNRPRG